VRNEVGNFPDNQTAFLYSNIEHLEELVDAQERFKLFRAVEDSDLEVRTFAVAMTTDVCKFLKGAQQNIISRMVNKNHFDSLNVKNVTCPLYKGLNMIANITFTDALLPPFLSEVRARIVREAYGKLRGHKNWTKLFVMELWFRVKK
jgi:hypothetical protein